MNGYVDWQALALQGALLVASLGAAWLIALIVRWLWGSIFLRLAARTPMKLDTLLLQSTRGPAYYVALSVGAWVAFRRAASVLPQADAALLWIDNIFFALAALSLTQLANAALQGALGWYGKAIADRTSGQLDDLIVEMAAKIARLVLFFLALTVILGRFNVNITGFIATAGVASLAVAFAAQETLANMIAGLTILLDRPFGVGDRIHLATGEVGDVLEIGLRSTKILSFDHTVIVVPNKEMTDARLINQSYPDKRVKIRPKVGVAYRSDLDRVKAILLETCREHPLVLDDPAPGVYFTDFGDSALNLTVICWVADYRDAFQTLDELNMAIYRRFQAEGIEIPFPQRDVHLYPHA